MKLYTEEQVREILMSINTFRYISDSYIDDIIDSLTPIELPSDEEIEKAYEFLGTWTAKEIMQRSTSLISLPVCICKAEILIPYFV
jgi:hypothetical protein